MTYTIQIAIDAADPHELAAWWAQTLHWKVEPSDEEFIRRMVAEGHANESETTTYAGVLVWRAGQAILSADPAVPRVLFQLVPEAKSVKNRLHLDVRVGDDDVEEVVARLIQRGATRLWDGRQGPHTWVTMSDPEGNEFCVSG